jgi:hypothetical protein
MQLFKDKNKDLTKWRKKGRVVAPETASTEAVKRMTAGFVASPHSASHPGITVS